MGPELRRVDRILLRVYLSGALRSPGDAVADADLRPGTDADRGSADAVTVGDRDADRHHGRDPEREHPRERHANRLIVGCPDRDAHSDGDTRRDTDADRSPRM